MNLVHNERVKLLATLLNTVAAVAFVVGALTPFTGTLTDRGQRCYGLGPGRGDRRGLAHACVMLHGAAWLVLGGLRE